MTDKERAKSAWNGMNNKYKLINRLGLRDALPITKEVAICILSNPGIIVEDIIRLTYFEDRGRSTIKRAVGYLYTNNFIEFDTSILDGRKHHIYFCEVTDDSE